jgi:DNA polymerase kappa
LRSSCAYFIIPCFPFLRLAFIKHRHSQQHLSEDMLRYYRILLTKHIIRLDDRKAGFDKVDKQRVEAIMNEASRGSKYYLHEQRLAALRQARVEEVASKCNAYDALSAVEQMALQEQASMTIRSLEHGRLMGVFAHLDMDAFYASVAEKKNPSLRGVPFGVGGLSMLSTTNYVARGYGVRSGIPGFIGKQLCPQLVLVPLDFPAYIRASEAMRGIVAEYDQHYFSVGLDEVTLNVEPHIRRYFPNETATLTQMLQRADVVLKEIRDRILAVTGLTASGGTAPTVALSKVAGNKNKPNGQFLLNASTPHEVMEFLKTLPIRKFPGVGRALEEIATGPLKAKTCGDLLQQPERVLYSLSPHTARFLLGVGLGTANAGMPDARPHPKSISHSRTIPGVITHPDAFACLTERFLQLCCESMQEQRLVGRVVGLSIKTHNYEIKNSSKHAPVYSNDPKVLVSTLRQLLTPHLSNCSKVRLIGVRMSDIVQLPADGTTPIDDDDGDDEG